jgi:hypothetical protein
MTHDAARTAAPPVGENIGNYCMFRHKFNTMIKQLNNNKTKYIFQSSQ